MLTHVLFDLYGTLLDIKTDEQAPETALAFEGWVEQRYGMQARAGEHEQPLVSDLRRMQPGAREHAEPDIDPVIRRHLERILGRGVAPEEVRDAAQSFRSSSRQLLRPIAGARQALQLLGARFGLGLVSNAQWLFTEDELASSGLTELLAVKVISSELGVRKPSRDIFLAALERVGARAEHTLFVGNDPVDDVLGASSAGLRTCLVGDGRSRPWPAVPDLHLPSVAALPALLLGADAPSWV